MTEPLSTTAAAVGFLSLGGQLADGLIKLRRFYTDVRNAPTEVSWLISSTQNLQTLLDAVGQQLDGHTIVASASLQALAQCLFQCRSLQKNFNEKLVYLNEKFRAQKANQLLMPFRKQEVETMLKEIERCKISLLVAQQAFAVDVGSNLQSTIADQQERRMRREREAICQTVTALQQEVANLSTSSNEHSMKFEAVLQAVEIANAKIGSIPSHRETTVCRSTSKGATRSEKRRSHTKIQFQLVPLGLSIENITAGGDDEYTSEPAIPVLSASKQLRRQTTVVEVRVPRWFAQDQYTVCLQRAISGWKFRLCVYRDLPDYTPFLAACVKGPYVEVRRFLEDDPAVLCDRVDGMTGADIALMNCNVDIYHVLSCRGARPQMDKESQISIMLNRPFHFATRLGDSEFPRGFGSMVEDFLTNLVFICSQYGIEPEEVTEYAEAKGAMSRWGRREYRMILRLFRQYPEWSSEDAVQAGLLLAPSLKYLGSRYKRIYEHMIHEFRHAFSSGYLLHVNNFSEGARSMLHMAALRLAEAVVHKEDTSLWTTLLRDALQAGLDIHMKQHPSYWLPCLARKPWATPLGLYTLSLSIQEVPWGHHSMIREPLPSHEKFDIFFGAAASSTQCRIPPLPAEVVQKIDHGLQYWARFIESLGIDLQAYGVHEILEFEESAVQSEFEFEQVSSADNWLCWLSQVRTLRTGPNPSDWHFEYLFSCSDGTQL